MKKGVALSLTTALLLSACGSQGTESARETDAQGATEVAESAESTSDGPALYTPGTYTEEALGHEGMVKVTVTVSETEITDIEVDASLETPEIGGAAQDAIREQILEAQSGDIDGVSGATETKDAAVRALNLALSKARGEEASSERSPLEDGTYTATVSSFGVTGQMTGEVEIQDNQIVDIRITEEHDSETGQWFSVAEQYFIPRVLEAQSLSVDAVSGATTSSGAIRNIVAFAIQQAGGDSSTWYVDIPKEEGVDTYEDFDVIVVGLGGSGMLSYLSAANTGAAVIGFEAAAEVGGNSVSVYGPMAVNSQVMAEKYNDGEDYIDGQSLYDTWIEYVGTDEKADIIERAVFESGTSLDYYINEWDFSFDGLGQIMPSFTNPEWDKEWVVYTADEENTKWYAFGPDHLYQFKNAMDKALTKNEENRYFTETRINELILDEDGAVIGVRGESYTGRTVEAYGKTVILATGGFLGNADMFNEVYGSTIRPIGVTLNNGTGIQLGQSIGAATYALGTLPMVHVSQVPNIIRDDSLTADQKAILSALAVTSDGINLIETGEILDLEDGSGTTNEELEVAIVFAPGFHYYKVYTEADIEKIRTEGLTDTTSSVSIFGLGQGGTVPEAGTPIEDIDTILEVAIDTNNAWHGNASELASALGMEEANLIEVIGNEEDQIYLIECAAYSYGTVGSLDVNRDMQVLKEDGTVIENLFAVGQDSEGVANADGKAYSPWGGQAQSWTFVSGKIAGEKAAEVAGVQ